MKSFTLSLLLLVVATNSWAEEILCTDTNAIKTVVPNYPLKESPKPQTGYVILSFKISDRGYVYDPKVIESYATPSKGWAKLFEEEAIKALMQYHFRYREKACIAEQKFTFELQN